MAEDSPDKGPASLPLKYTAQSYHAAGKIINIERALLLSYTFAKNSKEPGLNSQFKF
jgi:hypothetical protein